MKEFKTYKVVIAGAGGIGRAVGLILAEYADFNLEISLGDRDVNIAKQAADWINCGNSNGIKASAFHFSAMYESLPGNVFAEADIVLDCLPGAEAPRIGTIARKYNLHYVNLTEYVSETNQLIKLAENAPTGFVLQTGLAPGFINILANSLYHEFVKQYGIKEVEYIGMKVGALTENVEAPHFYGFTWSPIGVATEYLKDAYVVRNYKKSVMPSLTEQYPVIINGTTYEESFTSGGAADLPDAFEGIARNLDYKTLRYPGHYDWVKGILSCAPDNHDKVGYLEKTMLSTVPAMDNDMVIIYAIVKGFDVSGCLRSVEKAFKIYPGMVGNARLRAIQLTTAAPMAECARMLLLKNLSGAILQSQINPEEFLNGPFVQAAYYGNKAGGNVNGSITVAA